MPPQTELIRRTVRGLKRSDVIEDIRAIDRAIAELEAERQVLFGLADILPDDEAEAAEPVAPPPQSKPARRGSKKAAVLRVLSDGRARGIREIADELISEGVMTGTDAEIHSLQVLLSRLYRKDRVLERPQTGRYRLASNGQPTNDEVLQVMAYEA